MTKSICAKRRGSGAMAYLGMFMTAMVLAALTLYMVEVSKLMTHQHHIDDSLASAVLASLVADDVYYFETYELTGTPVVRLRSTDESYAIFKDILSDAVAETSGFYYDFSFDTFICYDVNGDSVTVTEYTGNSGVKKVSKVKLGKAKTPGGIVVKVTSAYGKVRFGIKSAIGDSLIMKTRDIYCTLETD